MADEEKITLVNACGRTYRMGPISQLKITSISSSLTNELQSILVHFKNFTF